MRDRTAPAAARNVRVLYFEGCPNHRPTVELVRRVAAELGVPVEIEQIAVLDALDAKRLRFFGSPTVQVDAQDIEPRMRAHTDYSLACRMYAGFSGVPPEDLLRSALTSGPVPSRVALDSSLAADARRASGGCALLASAGAVATAAASTSCCWLSALLIAAGASAAGVGGFVESWRPYLGAAALALLGWSFYAEYIRRPRCDCSVPPWSRKLSRIVPWIATVIVATALFFPHEVGAFLRGAVPAPTHKPAPATHAFIIDGMTCANCASSLEHDLAALPGVSSARVNFSTRTAEVTAAGEAIAAEVARIAEQHGWKSTPR